MRKRRKKIIARVGIIVGILKERIKSPVSVSNMPWIQSDPPAVYLVGNVARRPFTLARPSARWLKTDIKDQTGW